MTLQKYAITKKTFKNTFENYEKQHILKVF